ncbi:hypothetical protein QTP70_012032 [Hemibagrus guttatus]|uniref:Reverse transcriptase domain-containing protein n=1 Tax=Hemibagrus guttatus TaxID=175788 RepID=A0AAE0R2T4_9TELE|nr:hypothetical protein QTP70_012032 [Hemibagrus guttatus]
MELLFLSTASRLVASENDLQQQHRVEAHTHWDHPTHLLPSYCIISCSTQSIEEDQPVQGSGARQHPWVGPQSLCYGAGDVLTSIFNLSLSQSTIPTCFKTTTIVPLPKKRPPTCLNDYRPVALTPIIIKCFERVVLAHIQSSIPDTLDPLQYAYRPNRSILDAIAAALHISLSHLEDKDTYIRMLFIDYSSTFNTVIPHKLTHKLFALPILYTLFTHACIASHKDNIILKFADDTAVITGGDESAYRRELASLVTWCENNYLTLNTDKTKYEYFNAVLINEVDEEGNNMELGGEFILQPNEHFNNLSVNLSLSVVQVPTNMYNKDYINHYRKPFKEILSSKSP